MSSAMSLLDAFFLWVVLIIIAIVLLIGVSMPLDLLIPQFTASGLDTYSAEWGTTGDRDFLRVLVYVIDFCIIIFGGVNFLASSVRRQEYDVQQSTEYYR